MKKALFDTSVYGGLLDDDAALGKVSDHVNSLFLLFGSSTVRLEHEKPADRKQISDFRQELYRKVNSHYQLKNPEFVNYVDFTSHGEKYGDENEP